MFDLWIPCTQQLRCFVGMTIWGLTHVGEEKKKRTYKKPPFSKGGFVGSETINHKRLVVFPSNRVAGTTAAASGNRIGHADRC